MSASSDYIRAAIDPTLYLDQACNSTTNPPKMHSLLAAGVLLATALSTAAASPTTAFAADVPYSTPSVYLAPSPELGNDTLEARDIRSPLQNRALNMEHMFQPLLDFDKDGVSSLAL